MLSLRTSLLLAGSLLGASLAPLGSSSIAVAIPLISSSVISDPALVTRLLVGGYLFISIVGQVPGGRMADRFGALPILNSGLAIYTFGCLLGFFIENLVTLTISRGAMALGTALIGPATAALIRRQIPVNHLPFAFGIFGTTMSGAAAIGPWIGGLVVSQAHWSWVFAINLPVAMVSAALIFSSIDRQAVAPSESARSAGFDWQGIVLLAIAVLCMQIGLGIPAVALLVASMVFFYLFYRQEKNHPSPILHGDLLENPVYLKCCAVTGLNNFTMYALMFQIPLLLVAMGEKDPLLAGTVLLFMTIAMMACGPFSGWVMNSLGNRTTLVLAQLSGLVGLIWMIILLPIQGLPALAPGLIFLGLSVGLTMPLIQSNALGSVPSTMAGSAAGGSSTARYIGGALGVAVMALMLNLGESLQTHINILYIYCMASVAITIIVMTLPQVLEVKD